MDEMQEPTQEQGPAPEAGKPRRRLSVRRLLSGARRLGGDVAALIRGRPSEPPPEGSTDAADAAERLSSAQAWTRIKVLRQMTDRLRGAADEYLAVKLDEIEALVDAKLDEIEKRVDKKVLDLMDQLRKARDEELRHRLRLLKLTLIFSVLVALISLVYKWVTQHLAA